MGWETSSNVTLSSCMSSFSSSKEWLRYLAWIALCDETLGTRNHEFICSYKRSMWKPGNWRDVLLLIVGTVSTLILIFVCNNISKLFSLRLAKRLVKFGRFLKFSVSPIAVQAYLSLLIFGTKLWQPCEKNGLGKFENFSNIGHLVPRIERGSSEKLTRLVRHEYYWYWRLNIFFVLFLFFFFQDSLPDLYNHFQYNDIETHMYASQWFLTLFTAKFPLPMVYRIMDLFLCHVRNLHLLHFLRVEVTFIVNYTVWTHFRSYFF